MPWTRSSPPWCSSTHFQTTTATLCHRCSSWTNYTRRPSPRCSSQRKSSVIAILQMLRMCPLLQWQPLRPLLQPPVSSVASLVRPAPSQEFAGNASAVPDLIDPLSLIQPHADFHWNADSGCTSTMTPHKHWLHSYCPCHVPVELADGSIIYSAGVGAVVIDPVLDGKRAQFVELSCILHILQLRSNLLSCLYSGLQNCSNVLHFHKVCLIEN